MAKERIERDDEDLVRLYLTDIGQYPLLTKDDEVRLAQAIEAGRESAEKLEAGGKMTAPEKRKLKIEARDTGKLLQQKSELEKKIEVERAKAEMERRRIVELEAQRVEAQRQHAEELEKVKAQAAELIRAAELEVAAKAEQRAKEAEERREFEEMKRQTDIVAHQREVDDVESQKAVNILLEKIKHLEEQCSKTAEEATVALAASQERAEKAELCAETALNKSTDLQVILFHALIFEF